MQPVHTYLDEGLEVSHHGRRLVQGLHQLEADRAGVRDERLVRLEVVHLLAGNAMPCRDMPGATAAAGKRAKNRTKTTGGNRLGLSFKKYHNS